MKVSVIIPVFNELSTVEPAVRAVLAVNEADQILIVDDGSTDGTRDLIRRLYSKSRDLRAIFHDRNRGKGGAVRTGIASAEGDAILIQDADMEYDPKDYPKLIEAMRANGVNAVYGSRFLDKKKVTSPFHRSVNALLTGLTNLCFGSQLTDMETCYKLVRTPLLRSLALSSQAFDIEVEITAKLLKRGERILEVPIRYKGRSYHEGKKIGWKDGVHALWSILRHRLSR